jgi:hypothetical protein
VEPLKQRLEMTKGDNIMASDREQAIPKEGKYIY